MHLFSTCINASIYTQRKRRDTGLLLRDQMITSVEYRQGFSKHRKPSDTQVPQQQPSPLRTRLKQGGVLGRKFQALNSEQAQPPGGCLEWTRPLTGLYNGSSDKSRPCLFLIACLKNVNMYTYMYIYIHIYISLSVYKYR